MELSDNWVKAGTPVDVTVTAIGGQTPLRYSFEFYQDNDLVKATTFGLANTYTYTPVAIGEWTVLAKVKDANGTVAEKTSEKITVFAELTIEDISASVSSLMTGEPVSWTIISNGGKGVITYDIIVLHDGEQEYVHRVYNDPNLTYLVLFRKRIVSRKNVIFILDEY